MNDITPRSGNLRDVLYIIFKYKLIIILSIAVALLAAVYINRQYKAQYQAASKLLVKIGRENTETQTTPSSGSKQVVATDSKSRINNEIVILKSREIAENVISEIGSENIYPGFPSQLAVPMLQMSLAVESVTDSNIIRVLFTHDDRKKAATILNKIVEEYIDHHLKIYQQSEAYDFFNNQVKELSDQLKETSEKLQKLKQKYDIFELDEQKKMIISQIYSLKNDQAATEIKIAEETSKLNAQIEKELSGDEMGVLEEKYNPVAINAVKSRLNSLKLELKELLVKYKENNVLVQNKEREIANAEDLVEFETKLYYNKTKISLQDSIEALKTKQANTAIQIDKLQKELSNFDRIENEYMELVRQDKINADTYALYLKRLEEERISGAMDSQKFSNIYVIEKAYPPLMPVSKANKKFNILISLVIGTALGIFTAFLIEYFNHCFKDRDDIKEHLQLNVLASIPDMKN